MTDYKILSSTSKEDLATQVKTSMAQGWGPYGNLLITYVYSTSTNGYVYTYYQPMVKP